MSSFIINGPARVQGSLSVSGSKNAVLALLAASLMCPRVSLRRVPNLLDVSVLMTLLQQCGVVIDKQSHHHFVLDCRYVSNFEANYHLVRQLRASFFVLGPLLTRHGFARISLPGGCKIGERPVDLHLDALRLMGANISIKHGYVTASAPDGLKGAEINFAKSSVGATHTAIMAATLAKGRTTITNAACEPEVGALIDFLNAAGAKISGKNSSSVTIDGVLALNEVDFELIPDRIQTGTYLIAAAMTQGQIELQRACADHVRPLLRLLTDAGADVVCEGDTIALTMRQRPLAQSFTTAVYPDFPTDLQAPMMALNAVAEGCSEITETMFENRFMHVPELVRMGADIAISGQTAHITGVSMLEGAQVQASDLRAGAALVLAGMCAKGKTSISKIHHIDRGYEYFVDHLKSMRVSVERSLDEQKELFAL